MTDEEKCDEALALVLETNDPQEGLKLALNIIMAYLSSAEETEMLAKFGKGQIRIILEDNVTDVESNLSMH